MINVSYAYVLEIFPVHLKCISEISFNMTSTFSPRWVI